MTYHSCNHKKFGVIEKLSMIWNKESTICASWKQEDREGKRFSLGPYVPVGTKRRGNVGREIFVVPLILTRVSSFGTCLTTLSRSSSVKVTRTQFSSSVGRGSFPSLVTQGCSYNMVISYQYYYKNDINSSVIKIMVYLHNNIQNHKYYWNKLVMLYLFSQISP